MEITIDLETCKIIAHFGRGDCYAVFITKPFGNVYRLTIEELIELFDQVSKAEGD